MAYCVHCGVRLGDGETHCPLCGIVSIDPLAESAPKEKAYPQRNREQELHHSKRFFLALICILFLTPTAICLLCDILPDSRLSWSLYPISALILMFITFFVSIMADRHKPLVSLLTMLVTLNAYLFIVENLSHTHGWFFPIAFPSILAAAGLALLGSLLHKHRLLNTITWIAFIMLCASFECFLVEILCSLSRGNGCTILWSWFVFIPCFIIAICLFLVNSNSFLYDEFKKRLRF